MKTRHFALFLILIGLTGSVSQAFALNIVEPMTPQEMLDKFDLIVLGTVIHVEQTENKHTTFQIEIEEIVKGNDSFEKSNSSVNVIGCTPNEKRMTGFWCPRYDAGDRGLFLLSDSEQGLRDIRSDPNIKSQLYCKTIS